MVTKFGSVVTGLSPEQLPEYIPNDAPVIAIVDEAVQEWFSHYFPAIPFITIHAAETVKTLETIEKLTLNLLNEEADRTFFLLGVGGGIVCDITGFLASTYMRGVRFGFIPTTLLAQVDAALGGKNGVNVSGYKNITGTFTQPEFVLCTTDVLSTLPERVFNAGMSEVIKAALIADAALFDFIEQYAGEIINRKEPALSEVIHRAAQIKLDIVAHDEKEKGERRKLNLGHTLGHAIERSVRNIMHGEAVSIGLAYAARFSQRQGWLTAADVHRITALLQRFRLPVDAIIPIEDLQETMMKDKKKSGVLLHYIALTAIGKAVEVDINISNFQFLIPNS
ncbi:MAG: 3-dehydroquinate synthase [Prevotellaceae bacterium]|jgi:3-dehydroquinate synthase|nr:3-dehydroquinate synthase [Prevotellaceae bacterium]